MRTRIALLTATVAVLVAPAGAHAAGRYIVVLKDGVKVTDAARSATDAGAAVKHVYRHALNGYSATLSQAALTRLLNRSSVAQIVADTPLRFSATQPSPPSWGLDRVDQRYRPLDGAYTYNATGLGVDAYIIDTGIRLSHQDFGGRAVSGVDLIDGGPVEDCFGHGTHVAGTVGGASYGVAKQVRLIGVRIGACEQSLSTSTAIAGIDWTTGHHQPGQPAVANMSFGGGGNTAMDTAVSNLIADGVTAVIAAGNGNALGFAAQSCSSSPGRVGPAVTVSSTDTNDKKVSYANIGACVDLFAPGLNIVSASYGSDTGSAVMSGTSMAAPHVAGAAALYLQSAPSATPAAVHAAIVNNATGGVVTSPGNGSPNRLLYTANFVAGGGPGNQAPTASFTRSCTNLACSFTDTSTDSDGTIASRSWNFGDGGTSTAAAPSHTYAAAGSYTATLTVTDNAGGQATTQQTFTVTAPPGADPDPSTPNLANGVPSYGTNGVAGTWRYYKIQVPAGRPQLRVVLDGAACALIGCNPDLDLYVRRAARPTTTAYNCTAQTGTSDETCTIANPPGDWWYIGIHNYSGNTSKSYAITATY